MDAQRQLLLVKNQREMRRRHYAGHEISQVRGILTLQSSQGSCPFFIIQISVVARVMGIEIVHRNWGR